MNQAFGMERQQTQKTVMSPQMQMSMNFLKMNLQELSLYIGEELKNNPVLETEENSENGHDIRENTGQDADTVLFADGHRDFSHVSGARQARRSEFHLADGNSESAQGVSLKEYLTFQMNISGISKRHINLGRYIIENIDSRGYLTASPEDIAEDRRMPLEEVQGVIGLIQGFDPPGVGAGSLKECLLLQVKLGKYDMPGLYDIIDNYLPELAENKIQQISKSMGIKVQQVVKLAEIIRSLDPKPGLRYESTCEVNYIIPDIIVENVSGTFEITVNRDTIPLLCVSSYYRNKALEFRDENAKKYIQGKLNSAQWIIKCIEQRKHMLEAITKAIVLRQRDFFENGRKAIKPMTMKDIAEELEIHESTVSRAVNGKYLQCSWGVFEIRNFFTQRMYCNTGEEISANKIKSMLKDFITAENSRKPLADSELADMFQREGILISRRTIAKYRGQLSIPAASMRRKF